MMMAEQMEMNLLSGIRVVPTSMSPGVGKTGMSFKTMSVFLG